MADGWLLETCLGTTGPLAQRAAPVCRERYCATRRGAVRAARSATNFRAPTPACGSVMTLSVKELQFDALYDARKGIARDVFNE